MFVNLLFNRAKDCCGYEPHVDFREGIERTVAWYNNVAETTNTHTRSVR
jgi:nucleoside-diphosphate-sugar epimerase